MSSSSSSDVNGGELLDFRVPSTTTSLLLVLGTLWVAIALTWRRDRGVLAELYVPPGRPGEPPIHVFKTPTASSVRAQEELKAGGRVQGSDWRSVQARSRSTQSRATRSAIGSLSGVGTAVEQDNPFLVAKALKEE